MHLQLHLETNRFIRYKSYLIYPWAMWESNLTISHHTLFLTLCSLMFVKQEWVIPEPLLRIHSYRMILAVKIPMPWYITWRFGWIHKQNQILSSQRQGLLQISTPTSKFYLRYKTDELLDIQKAKNAKARKISSFLPLHFTVFHMSSKHLSPTYALITPPNTSRRASLYG